MNKMPATVCIVDDDDSIRTALAAWLSQSGYTVVPAASGQELLTREDCLAADCLLLDVVMPEIDGIETLHSLAARGIDLPTIVMTGHGKIKIAVDAMKAGAMDFIEKPFDRDEILERIEAAVAARNTGDVGARQTGYNEDFVKKLTPREAEVMDKLIEGKPNKVVAHELGISVRTVEVHRARVMHKAGANNIAALVRLALDSEKA